jgi:phosphopantetheinyl transferase (holo-ACP synthase)
MYVHTTSQIGRVHEEFLPPTWAVTVLIASSDPKTDTAGRLVEQALGAEARRNYRSSTRRFPLCHRGRFFSVSHTAAVTVLAISTVAVGVDVEQRISGEAIADMEWALSDHEMDELAGSDECRLTEIWTTKEAAGKAFGVGLGVQPNLIRTLPVPRMPNFRTVELPLSRLAGALTYGWWIGNHHVSLAWRSRAPSLEVTLEYGDTRNAQQRVTHLPDLSP